MFHKIALITLLASGALLPSSHADEIAGRPFVWAHYVPWVVPLNTPITPADYYNYPLFESSGSSIEDWRKEFAQAKAQGIDGFLVDLVFHEGRTPTFTEVLGDMLAAAEGTDFQIAFASDQKTSVENQIAQFSKLLSRFSKHPNYPHYQGKPLLVTYTWEAWTPDEWRRIREGLGKNGYDVYLVANVNRGYKQTTPDWLKSYASIYDMAYSFSMFGLDGVPRRERAELISSISRQFGKQYMAALNPGYYGAWLRGRNDYYQPHRGFDQLHDCFLAAQGVQAQWLHFTTWNDHDETSVLPMLFTPANPLITRAYSDAIKHIAPERDYPEVCFAYHREEIPGTLLRIETLALPSKAKDAATVSGYLLDEKGARVFTLDPRVLEGDAFPRAEWLIPTAPLAGSAFLTPEVSVQTGGHTQHTKLPPIFLVNGWLQNAVTVKVAASQFTTIPNELSLKVNQAGDIEAAVSFRSEEKIANILLFRNDRPIASLDAKTNGKTLFNLFIEGPANWTLKVEDGEIIRSARKFSEQADDSFMWKENQVSAGKGLAWKPVAVLASVTPETRFSIRVAGEPVQSFSPGQLKQEGCLFVGKTRISLSPVDATGWSAEPSPGTEGRYRVSLVANPPRVTDVFYVRYELEDGRVALSDPVYPFDDEGTLVEANLVQTSINMETASRLSGRPGESEFLSQDVPLKTPTLVKARISLKSVRWGQWKFDRNGWDSLGDMPVDIPEGMLFREAKEGKTVLRLDGKQALKMRLRTWPIGNATVDFRLKPFAGASAKQSIIGRKGWSDGISINLLPDGKIEVVRDGSDAVPTVRLTSDTALPFGEWSHLRVTNDSESLRIYIDRRLDAVKKLTPARSYGNSTWFVGGGFENLAHYHGEIADLTVAGAAFAPESFEFSPRQIQERLLASPAE